MQEYVKNIGIWSNNFNNFKWRNEWYNENCSSTWSKKKFKHHGEIEFEPVSFNSLKKIVINHIFRLESSFQEILYMIDVWINNGSGWAVESIESQYINISIYRPLAGSFYMYLTVELRSPRIMLDILILQKNIQKELKKITKKLLKNLIMMELSFPCNKKILTRLKWKTLNALTCLVMKMGWSFQFIFQIKNSKTQ